MRSFCKSRCSSNKNASAPENITSILHSPSVSLTRKSVVFAFLPPLLLPVSLAHRRITCVVSTTISRRLWISLSLEHSRPLDLDTHVVDTIHNTPRHESHHHESCRPLLFRGTPTPDHRCRPPDQLGRSRRRRRHRPRAAPGPRRPGRGVLHRDQVLVRACERADAATAPSSAHFACLAASCFLFSLPKSACHHLKGDVGDYSWCVCDLAQTERGYSSIRITISNSRFPFTTTASERKRAVP